MRNSSYIISSITALCLAGGSLMAQPAEYEIDPVHSAVEFSVRHLGLSNVKGKFKKFSGTIWYNESDIKQSSVTVTIDAASIDTAEPKRDEHLRSQDFFEVAKYPDIRFRSTSIAPLGDKYMVKGYLTMHGTTKEVEIEAVLVGKTKDPWGNERLGVEGKTTLNRQDFGINYNKVLDNGALIISNDVKVELNIQAIRKTAAIAPEKPVKEAKPAETEKAQAKDERKDQ
ncbi:MAG: YceI family protein [Candidatus Sumerlaeaceae bacterium]|nr:YceI family protein [Candidatus Sumerlaeaceae bacterium]